MNFFRDWTLADAQHHNERVAAELRAAGRLVCAMSELRKSEGLPPAVHEAPPSVFVKGRPKANGESAVENQKPPNNQQKGQKC